MSRARVAVLASCALVAHVTGCATVEEAKPQVELGPTPSLVLVVDEHDHPRAVGAIVRTTTTRVVLLAASRGRLPPRLALARGEERLPTEQAPEPHAPDAPGAAGGDALTDVAVVDAPRRWTDLRPLGPSARVAAGQSVVVVTPGATAAAPFVVLQATVAEDGARAVVLASLPFHGPTDVRPAAQRAEEAVGGLVLAPGGGLLGFVTGAQGPSPVVTPLDALDGLVAAVTASEGRDIVLPGDEDPTFRLSIADVANLPAIPDEWGAPDLFLGVDVGPLTLDPLPLVDRPTWDPAAVGPDPPPAEGRPLAQRLVRAREEQGPLRLRLIERDVTLAAGDVSQELAPPVERPRLEPGRIVAEFQPLGVVPAPVPVEGPIGMPLEVAGPTRVTIDVTRVDPDAASGDDRTPLGAAHAGAVRIGRVVAGDLDVEQGDGTDFLAVDVEGAVEPVPVLVILLRRVPAARLRLQVFPPDFGALHVDLEAPAGRHLVVARALLPRGRVYVRLVHQGGPGTAWSLLLAPHDDPEGAVRALLRLVGREAETGLPYLGAPSFAQEVAGALSFEGGFEPNAASAAVLSELGARASAARHLALRILEAHLPPPVEALAAIFDEGEGARRTDAGLLLALRRPSDRRLPEIVALAAADPDPVIKRMALAVANRVEEPARKAALIEAARFADPTGTIERELARY